VTQIRGTHAHGRVGFVDERLETLPSGGVPHPTGLLLINIGTSNGEKEKKKTEELDSVHETIVTAADNHRAIATKLYCGNRFRVSSERLDAFA
jgi:hypothetical protein